MKKLNKNYLKLVLKTEIKWFTNSKKTILLTLGGVLIPYIIFLPGNDIEKTKVVISPLVFIFIGISACCGQFLYDSICKDIINKINIFYNNLNISIIYSFCAKILLCTPFIILFIIPIYFYNIQISFLIICIIFSYLINVCICSFSLVNFLFDPKSSYFALYIPFIYDFILALLLATLKISFVTLIASLILIILWILISLKILNSKKNSTNML